MGSSIKYIWREYEAKAIFAAPSRAKERDDRQYMRLRADFWVAAYLRRCAHEGASAVLRRRGAAEAGAIFVKLDRLDGTAALFGPAPQSETHDGEARLFVRLHAGPWIDPAEAELKIARQIKYDPDLWILETEDRQGRSFLELID
jgi:hypothetical protein